MLSNRFRSISLRRRRQKRLIAALVAFGLTLTIAVTDALPGVQAIPALAQETTSEPRVVDESAEDAPDVQDERLEEAGASSETADEESITDGTETTNNDDAPVESSAPEDIAEPEGPHETPRNELRRAPVQDMGISAQSEMMPLAAGESTTCSYGNTGSGQYKDTLCWLDFSYTDTNGNKQPVTTEWRRTSVVTQALSTTTSRCLIGEVTNFRATSTVTYASIMGLAYGSKTVTVTETSIGNCGLGGIGATNGSQAAANQAAETAADAQAKAGLSAIDTTYYGNVTGFPVDVTLPNSNYRLTALLDITAPESQRVRAVKAMNFPTWGNENSSTGAFLGRKGFYTGTTGLPALYHQVDAGGIGVSAANRTTTVTLKEIKMSQGGNPVDNYAVVLADAESTDANESIRFSHSANAQGMRWLPNDPTAFSAVNAGNNTNNNTARRNAAVGNQVCLGSNLSNWASINAPNPTVCTGTSTTKNGTAMLQVLSPAIPAATWSVTQEMTGGGKQGVAFGVLMARANLTVNVADRVLDGNGTAITDNFAARVTPAGSPATTVNTGTGMSATASPSFPVLADGTQLNFTSVQNAYDASYTQAWSCTKTGGTTPQYWPNQNNPAQTSATPPATNNSWFKLLPGYYIGCEVTFTPPYLTLTKAVDDAETEANDPASAWTLTASGASNASHVQGTTASTETTKRPVMVGSYTLGETAGSLSWDYGYSWTDLTCTPTSSSTVMGSLTNSLDQDGSITGAILNIAKGNDINCVYTNTANLPKLDVSKAAFNADGDLIDWGSGIDPESDIFYKLTFENSGSAAMQFSYVDYLADVLDDAMFNTGSVRIASGTESGYPSASMPNSGLTVTERFDEGNERILIDGTVNRNSTRTVWFSVKTFANSTDATERQAGWDRVNDTTKLHRVGYALNNYLVEAGADVPETCDEASEDTDIACTYHPIPAWTVAKSSRPAEGARLHKGGNVHYQITATKMNEATEITDLVFTDDLTHVFKTAGWAPNAAVPGGALGRGIYFFDEVNQPLDASGNPIGTAAQPLPAYDGASGYVPDPVFNTQTQRWTLTSHAVTLPENAVRAELWFAVEAGQSPVNIPDAATAWTSDPRNSIFNTPQTGWQFVNYVTADATLAPNQCVTGTLGPNTDLHPTADNPLDESFPAACSTVHELSDNYFTIRKDASGIGEDLSREPAWGTDPTGLWNLVGHEFEIRDDVAGEPSADPSIQLCRAEYNPYTYGPWDGVTEIANATPAWYEHSDIPSLIQQYNNENGTDHPQCALFYAQGTIGDPTNSNAGGQEGRWRSEYLVEGDYWLVETKAPDRQVSLDGSRTRPVPGVQLLAEPIAFTVWPDAEADSFGNGQSMEGRGQLDIAGEGADRPSTNYLDRCAPGDNVGDRAVACVNTTGYLMIVKDAVPMKLPLTGGQGLAVLSVGGTVVLVLALAGVWWWRRQRANT